MDFDAFPAGVEPGGLRSKSDIRILLCYILSMVQNPLSDQELTTIMQENGFANYFEVMDSLSVLQKMGSVNCSNQSPSYYTANEKTKEIARRLDTTLPLTVREKAINCTLQLLETTKRARENQVEIDQVHKGYRITCHVSGGHEEELMSFSLYVPDYAQAKQVKKNFLKDPSLIYRILLCAVTEDKALLQELLGSS